MDTLMVLIGAGMFSLALIRSIQHKSNGTLLWLALAPLVLAIGVSLTWKPILLFRGLIGAVPFLVLALMERLAGAQQSKTYRVVLAIILIPAFLGANFSYWAGHTTAKGIDQVVAAQTIRPVWQDGDVIMHLNDGTAVMLMALVPDLPQIELQTNCDASRWSACLLRPDPPGYQADDIRGCSQKL